MKKVIAVSIIFILLIGGLNAAAITKDTQNENNQVLQIQETIHPSKMSFKTNEEYIQPIISEQNSYLLKEGKPMLPIITKTYTFPIGSSINDITVKIDTTEKTIEKNIQPSPTPVPLNPEYQDHFQQVPMDEELYSSNELYPESAYSIKKGIGIENGQHVLYVTIQAHTQYKPAANIIYIPETIDILLDYQLPSEPLFNEDVYDLLIITSEKFVEDLEPLVQHKNSVDIKTTMVTVEEIYPDYNGVENWEDVKLFIKDAIEQWGIEFVLLAGGRKGQTDEWWVPNFRSNNYDNNGMDDMDITYSSDLYFADIYKEVNDNPVFDDWDTNDDGSYADGPYYAFGGYDKPDFYPDVYVGRIPFRYSWEVPAVVNKIINYENNADDSWFKKAVFVAGDTSPYERYGDIIEEGIYEGEETCSKHASYLEPLGFEITKLFTSTGIRNVYDVSSVISEGCGWVNMQMHANPANGGNHITDLEDFATFYSFLQMHEFTNEGKLPFMINDGCHNAQFDVTLHEIIENGGVEDINLNWYEWIPTDASSWFILKETGGAIGLIGNTALGYGYLNQYWEMGLGGWIMPRFAHAYAVQGKEYTGSVWAQGITDYVNNFAVDLDIVERKTIEERGLLGDPSIKLGGYGIGTLDNDEDEDDSNEPQSNTLGTVETPVWEEGMSWTYEIDELDVDISEVEGRKLIVQFESGDIIFTVTEATGSSYTATVTTDNLEVFLDAEIESFGDIDSPIRVTGKLIDTAINGEIKFDKSTLGIIQLDLSIDGALDTESILENVDFDIPPILLKLFSKIPFTVSVEGYFDKGYELIDYPLSIDKEWGLPEGSMTIDGTIKSPYLRPLSIMLKLARLVGVDILPPAIVQNLPVIDIASLLNDLGMSNELEISEFEKMFGTSLFLVRSEDELTVDAGTFTTYNIQFFLGAGNFFYSPEVQNIVRIDGNIDHFIPIIDTISLELVDTTVQ